MKNAPLDPASLKILAELQKNGRVSSNELAEKIGMSASPCWRRQKELEENGYIVRYTALLDRRKLGLAVVCLLHVSLQRHAEGVVEQFEEVMRLRPEVVECYETTGSSDYMVKVVVADMEAYHDFLHNVMVKLNGLAQVNTSVALREVKYDTTLPL
ncbi:Lrp/AsnC family transcriptional regulator [Telluria beijingensis]|uniref:Lrp/AsnC family transcriptional regulator n=1 Tax=Telluria beijingensis TaxID=3068633 RepID=UPI002795E6C2|nr:Lrp/AsnC family transcriptional regulator [Massilia sp. REN29]